MALLAGVLLLPVARDRVRNLREEGTVFDLLEQFRRRKILGGILRRGAERLYQLRRYLNAGERRKLLAAIDGVADSSRRAFCLTLFYCGCRISEALNLTTQRIDFSEKCLEFETLKRRRGGIFRPVPIPDSLCLLLRRLIKEHAGESRVWTFSRATGYRCVKQLMAEAEIVGGMASPKGMRHAMAVACLEHNIPLTTVRKWLGHARLETTAIYLELSGAEDRKFARRLWAETGVKP